MVQKSLTEAVAVLNRAVAADPAAISALVNYRAGCNETLALDISIQVGRVNDDPGMGFEVGIMGIINGIFGTRPNRCGRIAAIVNTDSSQVVRFIAIDDEGKVME